MKIEVDLSCGNVGFEKLFDLQKKEKEIGVPSLTLIGMSSENNGHLQQSYEIKSAPWTILWFRILELFSVENKMRLCVFMFQT